MQNPLGIKSWNPLKSQIPLGVFPPLGAQSGPDPKSGNFLGFLGGIFWEFFVTNPRPIPKSRNFLRGQFFQPNPWIKFSCKDFFFLLGRKIRIPNFLEGSGQFLMMKNGNFFFFLGNPWNFQGIPKFQAPASTSPSLDLVEFLFWEVQKSWKRRGFIPG